MRPYGLPRGCGCHRRVGRVITAIGDVHILVRARGRRVKLRPQRRPFGAPTLGGPLEVWRRGTPCARSGASLALRSAAAVSASFAAGCSGSGTVVPRVLPGLPSALTSLLCGRFARGELDYAGLLSAHERAVDHVERRAGGHDARGSL